MSDRKPGLFQSPYDSRDYKFKEVMPVFCAGEIPDNYESSPAPFIYDQGTTNMCAAYSSNMLRFLQERNTEQSELNEPLSAGFTYADRLEGEEFEGMYLRSVAKKWQDDGGVLQSQFPVSGNYMTCKQSFLLQKDKLLEEAKPFRISSYYTCNSRKEVQTAIMQTQGVLIGISMMDNFYTPQPNGKVEFEKGQSSDGGHAVLLRGWKTENGKLYWLLQNSWGREWGINGCCWLSEEWPWLDNAYVFIDYISEMKIQEYKKQFNIQ